MKSKASPHLNSPQLQVATSGHKCLQVVLRGYNWCYVGKWFYVAKSGGKRRKVGKSWKNLEKVAESGEKW